MKYLVLSLLACTISLAAMAQVVDTPRVVGKFFGSQSGAGAGYWQISGTFTDESGLYDSQGLKVGDVIFFADAGIGYHLPIISIQSATPPSFTLRVNNTGITNISSVPTGLGAVYEPRPNHAIMPYASGITNPDQQTYMGYVMELIDNIGGGTTYYPADGIEFSNDSIKVDTTVMRYNLFPIEVGDDTYTGYFRHNQSWGNQWSDKLDGNYYSIDYTLRSGDDVSSIKRVYVKPEAAGAGGYGGNATTYDPTEGIVHQVGALNYGTPSPGAYTEYSKEGVKVVGQPPSGSAYNYTLAAESPSLDSNEVMLWNYNGDGTHTARFNNIEYVVQAYSGLKHYEVAITGGNTDSKLFVTATRTGITAAYSSNKLTVTVPAGTSLLSADWHVVGADVQSAADGGGTTNWVQTQFIGIPFNGDITELVAPNVQKIAIPTSGGLSVTNAATYDFDNNPAVSVVAAAAGTITIRTGGVAPGSQGYSIKFSNF